MKTRECTSTNRSIFTRKSCAPVRKSVYNPSSNKLIQNLAKAFKPSQGSVKRSTHVKHSLCFLPDALYTQPRHNAGCAAGNRCTQIDPLQCAVPALPASYTAPSPAAGNGNAELAK